MQAIMLAVLFTVLAGPAQGACACRCVGGTMQAVCARAGDRPVVCRPGFCRVVPPAIRPLERRPLPPLGPRYCRDLTNPDARRYGLQGRCF